MGRPERLYAIDQLLKQRGALTLEEFIAELEVSRATFRRDLDYLRERLHSPILWDAGEKKYRYDGAPEELRSYALPGLWFNQSEIHALLTMQQLLDIIESGLLAPHLGPFKKKLLSLLDKGQIDHAVVGERVKISPLAKRRTTAACFEVVASALLHRQRLLVTHHNRHTDETLEREISPLRLVYYRDNWYLDSWCHLREDLRSFAVDSMQAVIALPDLAFEISQSEVGVRFDAGYGMFSGTEVQWATLRFSSYRARWIANEVWHRDQVGAFDPEGHYILKLPYNDPRELLGDILRQGAECTIVAPDTLRQMIGEEIGKLTTLYPLLG